MCRSILSPSFMTSGPGNAPHEYVPPKGPPGGEQAMLGFPVASQLTLPHSAGNVSVMLWIDTCPPVAFIIQIVKVTVCPGAGAAMSTSFTIVNVPATGVHV